MTTVAEALSQTTAALAAAGVPSPEFDAKALLAELLTGGNIARLVTRRGEIIPHEALAALAASVVRRCRREPLQYILGYTEFCGLRLKCDSRALIPRPDTEILVEQTLGHVRSAAPARPLTRVCDIGTGTGAIAIALAMNAPKLRLWASDASPEALSLAAENVALHGLEDRITLLEGEGLTPLFEAGIEGEIEAIVSNPPYVTAAEYAELAPEILAHEPRLALVGGGEDGLGFYRDLLARVEQLPALRLLAFEVGYDQAQALAELMTEMLGAYTASVHRDLGGIERVVIAEKTDE